MCELCLASISRHHSIQYEELWTLTLTLQLTTNKIDHKKTLIISHRCCHPHHNRNQEDLLHGKYCMHHKHNENCWLLLHFIYIRRIVSDIKGRKVERCVLYGTHLRSDGEHLLLSPLRKLSERRRTRNQNIQYLTVCGVTSPSTVHLLSGHGTGETLKTCLTGLRPAVSSPPVNKFLTESTSRATYWCWHCGELSSGPL